MINNLGKLKSESAAVQAEERRAKQAWEECKAEIAKLQRYAEKSVLAGDDGSARKFLEKKITQEEKEVKLQAAYGAVAAKAEGLRKQLEQLTTPAGQPDQLEEKANNGYDGANASGNQNQASSEGAGSQSLSAQERWAAIKAKRNQQE